MLDFIKNLSSTELIVILIILLVLFGARLITNLARTSGQSVKELKKIKKEFMSAIDDNKSNKN
jgi:sec-independent protein translocase protein TatA